MATQQQQQHENKIRDREARRQKILNSGKNRLNFICGTEALNPQSQPQSPSPSSSPSHLSPSNPQPQLQLQLQLQSQSQSQSQSQTPPPPPPQSQRTTALTAQLARQIQVQLALMQQPTSKVPISHSASAPGLPLAWNSLGQTRSIPTSPRNSRNSKSLGQENTSLDDKPKLPETLIDLSNDPIQANLSHYNITSKTTNTLTSLNKNSNLLQWGNSNNNNTNNNNQKTKNNYHSGMNRVWENGASSSEGLIDDDDEVVQVGVSGDVRTAHVCFSSIAPSEIATDTVNCVALLPSPSPSPSIPKTDSNANVV